MKGFKKIKLGKIPKTNKALWMEMKDIIKGRDVVLIKMESHLNYQEALGRGHSTLAWVANSLADGLAEFAAERSQHSLQHVDRVKLGDSMAAFIRVRCMAVLLDVMEKDPHSFEKGAQVRAKPKESPVQPRRHQATAFLDCTPASI